MAHGDGLQRRASVELFFSAHMQSQRKRRTQRQRGSARAARARRAAGRAQHPLCTEPTIHFYRPASTGSEQLRRRSEG